MTRRGGAAAVALCLAVLGGSAPPAAAQAEPDRGLAALRTGEYDDAVRLLSAAAASGAPAARIRAARALAEAHAAVGAYEQALSALGRAAADLPEGALDRARGRVLRELGRDEAALAAFDAAIAAGASDALPARLDRAVLLWERGGRTAAYEAFRGFIAAYNDGAAVTAAELTAVGTAVRYLGRRDPALFHDAVRAYDEAIAVDRSALEPRLRMAELFLDRYDGGEAQSLYGEVLEVNPRHPEALLGLARAKRFEGSSESLELVTRALEVNPKSPDGRSLLALLRLELGDGAGAIEEAGRALAVNPRHREALAVRAAAHFFDDDEGAYDADRERAFEVDPAFAGFFVTVAELAVRRGRYQQAVELAERAVAVDSTSWDGWAILGMNQLRTARLDAARTSLERAFEGDPFNVWTKNSLDLMDRLAEFETVRTDRFELVLHRDEAALLAPYVASVAEEAYEALSDRYGYRPETPVRVEVYPRHADFSVRTMGLPGLGALGVAFGNVLALDSPGARDRGAFHWGSTLWHEIAHAVTLGRTRHRIPRWLTEGISVHEERRSRPGWGGGIGLDLLQAFREDRLLPLREIDAGFVRPTYPGQVGISYQHASLIVARIEREHGPGALGRLMEAYADGKDTPAAFRDALGVDPDAFDRALASDIRERYAAGLAAAASLGGTGPEGHPQAVTTGPGAGRDPDALARGARMSPGDFAAQLRAGSALFRAGRHDEAAPFLERARSLYPEYAGPGSPFAMLAEIRLARSDTAGAVAELRRLTALDESALDANLRLADLLEAAGDAAGAADALERAIYIYPYEPEPHARLAELAATLGRSDVEVRERGALVALGPVDRAGALYRLALARRRAGDRDGARSAVMEALEIAPGYAQAQDLFLELSGGGQ